VKVHDIPAPDPAVVPPRLSSGPLPPYRYVPGVHPHPYRHAGGHAWRDGLPPEVPPWSPGPWEEDDAFRHAVDLFAHHYWWEAHEAWEGLWHRTDPAGPHHALFQGLIQAAAALLRRHLGDPGSAARLAEASVVKLLRAGALGGPVVHGVAVETFAASLGQALADGGFPRLRVPGRPPIRVVAGAVVEGGRVLAALRPPEVARGGLWELPGGKVELGEADADALVRELREELGCDVEVVGPFGETVHDYGDVAIRLVGLAARVVRGTPAAREHAEIRWVSAEALGTLTWAPADLPLLPALRRRLGAG
jgi:8-oxo-dGTP diphosphatase